MFNHRRVHRETVDHDRIDADDLFHDFRRMVRPEHPVLLQHVADQRDQADRHGLAGQGEAGGNNFN